MRVNAARKLIITSALSLFIAGFSAAGFWRLAQGVTRGESRLQVIESQIASLEEERKLARSGASLLEAHRRDLERFRKIAVNRERPVEFIETLENLAKDTKNTIVLDFDEGRSSPDSLLLRLTVEGSEESTRQYLSLLEFLPHEIRVEELTLQSIGGGGRAAPSPPPGTKGAPPSHRLLLTIRVSAS